MAGERAPILALLLSFVVSVRPCLVPAGVGWGQPTRGPPAARYGHCGASVGILAGTLPSAAAASEN